MDDEIKAAATDAQFESGLENQVDEFLAAWFQVRQIVQGLNFNRAHQHGLSTTQFIVLGFMEEAEGHTPCTIGWLAQRLNLDPATVVRTVDSLEKRGLAQRRRDKQDRRQVFVELTPEGRTTQQQSRLRFKNSVSKIFNSISAEGRAALVQGLAEFVAFAQTHPDADGTAEGEAAE